jgi:hypothetical protein
MKLCFNLKAPKWRPGMIIFIVWLVSLIVFVLFVVKSITPYQDLNKLDKEEIAVVGNYDTLYVACPKVPGIEEAKMNIEAHRNSLELFYMNNSHKKDASFTVYPRFSVKRVKEGAPKLEANMTSFSQLPSMEGIVQVKDSLITLLPAVYSKENKFAGEVQYIKLFVPDSTTVILKEPIDFTFGKSKSYRTGLKR